MAMRILTIALMTFLLLVISGCGQSVAQSVGSDVERYNPELNKDCLKCDLRGADLGDAYLAGAFLAMTNLTEAKLRGAKYDADTKWPEGFDQEAAGAVLVE